VSYREKKNFLEARPEELRWSCPPSLFPFDTTEERHGVVGFINQERAYQALTLGVRMPEAGYNIFVSGPPETGRRSMVQAYLEEIAAREPVPPDLCYVYNFQDPNKPKAISLPAGKGTLLAKDMENLVRELKTKLPEALQSKDYEERLSPIVKKSQEEQEGLFEELKQRALKRGLLIQSTKTGMEVIPILENRPISQEEFEQLPEEKKKEILENQEKAGQWIRSFLRKMKELQLKTKERIERVNANVMSFIVQPLFDDLMSKYGETLEVAKYLEEVRNHILSNIRDFLPSSETPFPFPTPEKSFSEYSVNVIVDNGHLTGAPVIFETNPTYYNLFGKIEKKSYLGGFYSDFTMIRAGSLHRANGGYLLVYAREVLLNPGVYDSLKRAIKFCQITIEDLAETLGFIPTTGLKPEPVPLRVKVIMIGSPFIYHLLSTYDEDFHRTFKVRADFDSVMENNEKYLKSLYHFVIRVIREDGLLPMSATGVARLAEHMVRMSGTKDKLTARFGAIRDVIREASFYAEQWGARVITSDHIQHALEQRIYRSNLIEEKILEMIRKNQILLDVRGKAIGQVNGLSVYQMGEVSFGRPSRITAQTFVGQSGVVDIEREVELSGPIHQKGVLILSGFLGGRFAQNFPLTLSATLCFEQSYTEVEGDSASAAELFALLSRLSHIPLRQDIAVTGSINQNGEIQPIGGVNEKIEGFFKTCKLINLTGSQGVIIPRQNLQDLMLNQEVIDAVKEGKFHIYPISTVEEGIEILTGIEAGQKDEKGEYPPGTVYYAVQQQLKKYRDRMGALERKPQKKTRPRKKRK